MSRATGRSLCVLTLWVFVGGLLSLTAARVEADSAALLKDADASLRASEKAMYAGDMDTARQELDKAAALVEQVKQADPKNIKIRLLEGRITKVKKTLDARAPKTEPAKTEGAAPQPAPAAQKLPGGVSYRLKEADRSLSKGERSLADADSAASAESRAQSALAAVKEARDKMAEIEQKFSGQYPADHPDIKAMNDRIAALEKQANEAVAGAKQAQDAKAQAAAQAATASAGWITRLKPFVTAPGQEGADREKYLVPSATREEAEMAQRLRIYADASAALNEYKAANVTTPTEELADIVKELARALKNFAASCESYSEEDFGDVEKKLGHAESFLAAQEAKVAAGESGILLQKDILVEIRGLLDRAASLAKKDDARVAKFQTQLDGLIARDAKLRAARVADTLMTADKFKGAEMDEIKQKAGEVLAKAHADAQVLRTTVISPDWKEESVIEHTDTTRTALRHRVTRSVTAQVAAKKGAETFLYTLYIGKDRRTDGTWGELRGHVMFTDRMLEENVSKNAP